MLLTEKYAPRKLDEVIGNAEAVTEVKKWALEFERGKAQKPLLLHGPPGVGKTAIAKALASEFTWSLIETNASNNRNPESLKKSIGPSGKNLYGEQRLILLDEIDGTFDRGEVPELVNALKETQGPMILTANDAWHKNLGNVRALCKQIEFKKVNARAIADLLSRIATQEKLTVEKTLIETVAKNSSGDVRSAIIDLQSGSTGNRDRKINVFEAVRIVFKTKEYSKSINASENLDIDLDNFTKWIEENIPIEYENLQDRAEAFQWLAKSDEMQARIRKRQYYGLLRYVRAYSHAGVSLSKKETYKKFTAYQFPSYFRTLAASKVNRNALAGTCTKIASKMHCSARKVLQNLASICTLPVEEWIELSDEEKKLLKKLRGENELKSNEKQKRKR